MLDPRVSAKPFLYTYDTRASVVAQLAMPTGQTIAYARDAQGRLLSTTLSGTASSPPPLSPPPAPTRRPPGSLP